MTDKHIQSEAPHSNMEKDPSDWVTGDEPMTGAQKSYLKTLSEEAGAEFDETLNKAEASEQIEALQQATGRGANHGAGRQGAAANAQQGDAVPKASKATKAGGKPLPSDEAGTDAAVEGDLFESESNGSDR